ncbi:hypothetical protein LAC81_25395 [Ensifer adhaerens]|uniref:hypothetical protein n=1 Tax=Ensifer adhaerens TaxID=106592 RepID=UPI001CC1638D|nr:hypothetical protein [Ensifer adhaerens]MBZ7927034.1 hypothetical protein [Ensifer adhaerens]UAX96664.1 hypothetical protein LAC78_23090 [Ensifer adhaerens]UAY03992.1 hypothetical protein LAC80_21870 [Ensifer adhaerens]UAY11978.1 hypothetical protein LAC81_25395 [Ensifer adhaerens]
MFDQTQSGYVLPEGFTVIASAFEKVVAARNIGRHSDEGECLAREALSLYMSGTRDTWELELRLRNACRHTQISPPSSGGSSTQVVDLLPELSAWARSLTASPEAATALLEQTLEHAIDHVADFLDTSDVRGWLVRIMVEIRLGRSRIRRRK